mgnify:CR=1 FL=1
MTKTKAQQIMATTEVRAADEVTVAIRDIAAEFEPYIIKQRRHFHKHPELSLAEERTTSDIANQLDAMNIPYERPLKTGLVATLRGTAPDAYSRGRRHRAAVLLAARRLSTPSPVHRRRPARSSPASTRVACTPVVTTVISP